MIVFNAKRAARAFNRLADLYAAGKVSRDVLYPDGRSAAVAAWNAGGIEAVEALLLSVTK